MYGRPGEKHDSQHVLRQHTLTEYLLPSSPVSVPHRSLVPQSTANEAEAKDDGRTPQYGVRIPMVVTKEHQRSIVGRIPGGPRVDHVRGTFAAMVASVAQRCQIIGVALFH